MKFISDIISGWVCYHYTDAENDEINGSDEKNKEVCERHPGFKWDITWLNPNPRCGLCWCCQPGNQAHL